MAKKRSSADKASAPARKSARKRATRKKPQSAAAKKAAARAAAQAMKDIIARARDHFRQAPAERVFYVADGRTLRDLKELADALDEMAEHVFQHHVNEHRHDFASWVHEVLQEEALAEQLRSADPLPEPHQRVIYQYIVRRVW